MVKKNLLFVLAIIFVSIECSSAGWFTNLFRSAPKWTKEIDKTPLIEAFSPRGLRVSISDVEGISEVAFHGKLNQCFGRGENGATNGVVLRPTNGRWVFIDADIEIKKDDALHYWISVKKGAEEYSFAKNVYVIRNLAPNPGNLNLISGIVDERISARLSSNLNEEKLCKCPTSEVPVYIPVPQSGSYSGNQHASVQQTQAITYDDVQRPSVGHQTELPHTRISDTDLSSELLTCGFQVDSLNEVILDFMKGTQMHSKLVLVGKFADTNKSAHDELKRFLIQYLELYDLGGKIKTASYVPCGIYFEMSSIVDKKRILLRAATDMKNVPCRFEEPESVQCL